MIPIFPNFKHLEASDRNEIKPYLVNCEPYSDYNFTSLVSWDLSNSILVSQLNNNLVVKFSDYLNHDHFYSFYGTKNVSSTAKLLLDLSKKEGLVQKLSLVTEPTIIELRKETSELIICEDRDNFDYIYKIDELAIYPGHKYSKKRKLSSRFQREVPEAYSKVLDLKSINVQTEIFNLLFKVQNDLSRHDHTALKRLLELVQSPQIIATGIYANDVLYAYLVSEVLPNNYAIGHMMNADLSLSTGIYAYLMKQNAVELLNHGSTLFNFEQDLGLENLRSAKMQFQPFLTSKKYTITYPTN